MSSPQSSRLACAMTELQRTQEDVIARELQEKLDAVVQALELTREEGLAYKQILLSGFLMPTAREARERHLADKRASKLA